MSDNETIIQRACEIWWERRSNAVLVNGFMSFVIERDDNWIDDCVNLTPREWLEDADDDTIMEFADEHGIVPADRDAVLESDAANEYAEVYQWFMLDDWLADKFAEMGEVIYDGVDGPVWGRQAFGQSVIFDPCVRRIVREYGDWAVVEAGGDPATVWGD